MKGDALDWLTPDWPAPENVRACVTTRSGGFSLPPFDSLNLGAHVGDDPQAVARNRLHLSESLRCQPTWLDQVHGTTVVESNPLQVLEGDASWSSTPGVAALVMTADCLPVLFCDRAGTRVAAAHAGWRGLANGVLEATVAAMDIAPENILAWMGPAIGTEVFEVGPEVRDAFVSTHPEAEHAFRPSTNDGKLIADMYALGRIRLASAGVQSVSGGGFCTVTDMRFFSYRRANPTGRFASLVWLTR
ncbi:peptidoglycan editing factor PgeF [Pseudomonas matsuisoli]|uniref:Purine nucleoside phosphorylase n=1 Tax=Pseudomonas matsuisoli TaxID=1515666 RepID=A0A917PZ29_9PSED|nr:peptidoglycan editing factor PgeF [Pseudomonas matsuisoli]GGK01037.1 laccase domain protein [Pseudomonas matsuisoli]